MLDSKIYTRSSKKNFININKSSILIPFRTPMLLYKMNSGKESYLEYNLVLEETLDSIFSNKTFSQKALKWFVPLLMGCSYCKG